MSIGFSYLQHSTKLQPQNQYESHLLLLRILTHLMHIYSTYVTGQVHLYFVVSFAYFPYSLCYLSCCHKSPLRHSLDVQAAGCQDRWIASVHYRLPPAHIVHLPLPLSPYWLGHDSYHKEALASSHWLSDALIHDEKILHLRYSRHSTWWYYHFLWCLGQGGISQAKMKKCQRNCIQQGLRLLKSFLSQCQGSFLNASTLTP